jgi:hypothetical protein
MGQGYVQEKFESTPGNEANTPTLSTKVLYPPLITTKPPLGADPMERDDELRNSDDPDAVITESYAPTWEEEDRMYPDLTGFRLKHQLGAPTTTAGDGTITDPDSVAVPAGAYKHVWTAPFAAGIEPMTTQRIYAYGSESVFFKQKGCACEKTDITTPDKGGGRIKVSGPALYQSRISDPSLTPAYQSLAVRPFVKANLTLATWLASSTNHQDFDISIASPVVAVRSLGAASKFPDLMEKDDGLLMFTGSVSQRRLLTADWDALLNASGFSAKALWTSESIIASAYPYKLYVEMSNCQYVGGDPDDLDNKRRHGASFNWKATNAGSASVTVTLINATASYA